MPDPGSHEISTKVRHARGTEEFGRVLAFSDGLFAIAMTLLIVAIAAPSLADADSVGELADALNDQSEKFVSFFISFAVIGRYWIAHHQFFARLAWMDAGLIVINLVYLAFIAFLPFPTDLLGTYFDNPLSVAIYAVNVAIISGLEVVLFRHAHRRAMMSERLPEDIYRWGVFMSLSPVVFFIVSVPVAFASTTVAVAFWFLGLPRALISDRWKPDEADRYLAG